MANKNFQNYAVAGNNVALTYDNVGDTVTIDVNVDKNDVGLGNVDNTSDINKPISTLVQNALNLKEGTITAGTTAQYYRGDKTFQTLDKTAVGLSNVDNTTDLLKPISTATQTALNSKQATISLTTTGSSGASTFAANVLNIPTYSLSGLGGQPLNANLTSVAALTYASTSFVKMTAAGTFALDTNTYLTAESDTLASVTGRGNTTTNAITVGGLTVATNLIYTDTVNSRVGISNSNPNTKLDVNGVLTVGTGAGVTRTGTINLGDGALTKTYGSSWSFAGGLLSTGGNVFDYVTILGHSGVPSGALKINSIALTGSPATGYGLVVLAPTGATINYSAVFNNGNVGIGTTTPTSLLDVNGTARIQNQLTTTGSITAASAIARGVYMNQTLVAAANNDVLVGLDIAPTFTNGAFTGVTNYALRINSGAVLFNNTTGISINGGGATYPNIFRDSSDGAILIRSFDGTTYTTNLKVKPNGNTIIQNGGTFTDAGFRLDVVGADSRFNGIRAGLGAGQVATNTVFGNGALNANTTGAFNTALGYQSMSTGIVTGTGNVAVGDRTLVSTTSGRDNMAIGSRALTTLRNGAENVGIGLLSLSTIDGSNNNTAIGSYSLQNNAASGNTAIGWEAAKTNTSGFGIVAIGYQALNVSTGNYNTSVGYQSLLAHTTGINNTAVGQGTVSGNFSGSVILGALATATANNQFVVGSSTVNAGAVTTATAVQTKTWDVIINGVAQKILLA